MKFRIRVRNKTTGSEWWEDYTKDIHNPEQWARELIEKFNETLREGEQPREFLSVEVMDAVAQPNEHEWEKQNLMTMWDGRHTYDVLKCRHCGCTAKRYGLDRISMDGKYRRKAKYVKSCPARTSKGTKR